MVFLFNLSLQVSKVLSPDGNLHHYHILSRSQDIRKICITVTANERVFSILISALMTLRYLEQNLYFLQNAMFNLNTSPTTPYSEMPRISIRYSENIIILRPDNIEDKYLL